MPGDHPDVVTARAAIQKSFIVRELLRHEADGRWPTQNRGLWAETGPIFSLLLLGELGAARNDAVTRTLDCLHRYYQRDSGLITYHPVERTRSYDTQPTFAWCITAVVLRAALLLDCANHPLVAQALAFLEEYHQDKGGWYCSVYSADPKKVHPPNCYMGTIKALSALSLIPARRRSKRQRAIIKQEVETCLANRVYLYRVDKKGQPKARQAWTKFSFPRYWRSDALEATDILTSLGVRDPRLTDSLQLIKSKRRPNGRWLLDFSETKRALIQLEEEKQPSKWVTLCALRTLSRV
ncbi:MAG: hypothetical protein ACFE9D_09090 [Promethearchaeota archaeon]